MFETDIPLIRRKYYLISEDMDWFIQEDENDYSFTGEIEVAFNTFNKDKAFTVCDLCNEKGMKVKIVKIEIKYSVWNDSI